MNRKSYLLAHIEPTKDIGLEIGALCDPTVERAEGEIKFVDYLDTEQLKKHYENEPEKDSSQVVDVDYVWSNNTLREALGPDLFFDYVIASHVIEHTPNMITWLYQIAEVLKPGGVLSLAIPDKRYIFDCLRQTSTTADLVDAFLCKVQQPTVRQVFDFISNFAEVDHQKALAGDAQGAVLRVTNPDLQHAYRVCRDQVTKKGLYSEAHCGVFTPQSFLAILSDLIALELFDFRLLSFQQFPGVGGEFFVTLERLNDELTIKQKLSLQRESLPDGVERKDDQPTTEEKQRLMRETLALTPEHENRSSLDQPQFDEVQAEKTRLLEDELRLIKNSNSWRLTAPLRHFRRRLTTKE